MFFKVLITLCYNSLHVFVLSGFFSLWQEPYHTHSKIPHSLLSYLYPWFLHSTWHRTGSIQILVATLMPRILQISMDAVMNSKM